MSVPMVRLKLLFFYGMKWGSKGYESQCLQQGLIAEIVSSDTTRSPPPHCRMQKFLNSIITGRNEVLAKVIFSQACLMNSVHRGGVWSDPGGGVCYKFSGGCLLQIFGGVSAPNFRGGVCSKFSGGGRGSPIFGIWSTFGRYASYWNAFLFPDKVYAFNLNICVEIRLIRQS